LAISPSTSTSSIPLFCKPYKGIPQQPDNRQIAHLIAFQKWKCQSESKIWLCFTYMFYRIPLFYFRIITSYLKMNGMPCLWNQDKDFHEFNQSLTSKDIYIKISKAIYTFLISLINILKIFLFQCHLSLILSCW
jgi:hypothetical protein